MAGDDFPIVDAVARVNAQVGARMAIVDEHIRQENAHDLDGIVATFGDRAIYEERAWGEQYQERQGVRAYYAALVTAMPDLSIQVDRRHVTERDIVLEVTIRGTHLGVWRGLPPTGRRIEFPLCAVYTFGADDKLAGERIYYDRATVLRQLGLYREPLTILGRLTTALTHPATLVRAYTRQLISITTARR
jgi:steroid delta-isomerase-like uncharacterized protein